MAASDRVSIPFTFYFPSGSSPQLYASQSAGSYTSGTAINSLEPVVGTSVAITDRNTLAAATIYQSETGTATYPSLTTNSSGGISGWVDPGSYKIVAAALGAFVQTTINFEAVRGDGVTLIAPSAVTAQAIAPNAVDSTKLATAVQQALVPVGTLLDHAGSVAPSGYLIANGQIVSTTTYSALAAVIGTYYNTGGEGTGNVRLPNLQQKVAVGMVNSTAVNAGTAVAGSGTSLALTLGQKGGVETYALTTGEMPNHSHGITSSTTGISLSDPGHVHGPGGGNFLRRGASTTNLDYGIVSGGVIDQPAFTALSTTGITLGDPGHGHTISFYGGGGAHTNIQPYVTINKIIKY